MQTHEAKKCIEIGQAEIELAIQFRFDKGEAYPAFGELAEPPTIEIIEATATTLRRGKAVGQPKSVSLGAKLGREISDWLLENPDRWE